MPENVAFENVVFLAILHHGILLDHVWKEKYLLSPRFAPWHRSQHKTWTLQVEKASYKPDGWKTICLPLFAKNNLVL